MRNKSTIFFLILSVIVFGSILIIGDSISASIGKDLFRCYINKSSASLLVYKTQAQAQFEVEDDTTIIHIFTRPLKRFFFKRQHEYIKPFVRKSYMFSVIIFETDNSPPCLYM